LTGGVTGKFYHRSYSMPGELIEHSKIIKVRIEANYNKTAGRIFNARVIKN